MRLKYIGSPGETHDEINMYGIVFPLGKVVTLDESDPKNRDALHKLPRHPHFEVVGNIDEALRVAASLGDPFREAQRLEDAKLGARVEALRRGYEIDKVREVREIAEQERLIANLAAHERLVANPAAHEQAIEAEKPRKLKR